MEKVESECREKQGDGFQESKRADLIVQSCIEWDQRLYLNVRYGWGRRKWRR